MSTEIADILSRVSLDPTRNPWQFISHELELIFYPPMPPGIVENLYIVAVLLAFVGFGAVLAIIIRIRKRIFWLWRVDAGLVRPHATIPWTLLSIFTTAFLELMISRRLLLMEQRPTYNTGYIILLAWCFVWLTGYAAIHSIATSLVVHLKSSGRNVRAWTIGTNVIGLGFPIVFLSVALTISVIGGKIYSDALHNYNTLQRSYKSLASTWVVEDGFNLGLIVPQIPVINDLTSQLSKVGTIRLAYYILFALGSGICLLGYMVIGSYYIRVLKKSLHLSRIETGTHLNDGQIRLKKTLNNLIMIMASLTLLEASNFAYTFYGCFSGAAKSTVQSTTISLAPLYMFACIGIPTTFLLARGAWNAQPRMEDGKGTAKGKSEEPKSRTGKLIKRWRSPFKRLNSDVEAGGMGGTTKGGGMGAASDGGTPAAENVRVTIEYKVEVEEDRVSDEKGKGDYASEKVEGSV